MWPFKSKKSKADLALEKMPQAIEVASLKWVEFEAQPFAAELDLREKVYGFTAGLTTGLRHWQAFRDAPEEIFLLIAIKGIEKSRTYLRMELEGALNVPIPGPYERTDEEELAVLQEKLIDRATRKWLYFQSEFSFKKEVALASQIKSFKAPFLEGVRADFPMFAYATDEEFDPLILIAIDRSGTHSAIEVQKAFGGLPQ